MTRDPVPDLTPDPASGHVPPPADMPLAVYGTLRRGLRNHHLLAGSAPVGRGTVAGVLHVVRTGEVVPYPYPALLLTGRSPVPVELYRVVDEDVWRALDALEHYDPGDPARSAYLRVRVDVTVPGGTVAAQTYVFHGERSHLGPVVPHGDWATHRDAS